MGGANNPALTLLEKLPNKTLYDGKLIIFTPFYNSQGYSAYIASLIETSMYLERLGIAWDYWSKSGDFHIERAVNSALEDFLASDATDILMIDSDERFEPMAVMRLLAHEDEVVGGAYRMKNRWEEYTCVLKRDERGVPVGKIIKDGTALIEALRVPAGFLRIKKSALLKFKEAYPDLHYQDGEKQVWQYFTTMLKDGIFFSQDYTFSERIRAAGVKLWIDPNITIGHFGPIEHVGNLDKHLREGQKTKQAFETVKKMAEEIQARSAA